MAPDEKGPARAMRWVLLEAQCSAVKPPKKRKFLSPLEIKAKYEA
jgi:hypothetical protein